VTPTVITALEEAVRLKLRLRLLSRDFSGLTPSVIEEMRRSRAEISPPD
jgi:hypothetical protein